MKSKFLRLAFKVFQSISLNFCLTPFPSASVILFAVPGKSHSCPCFSALCALFHVPQTSLSTFTEIQALLFKIQVFFEGLFKRRHNHLTIRIPLIFYLNLFVGNYDILLGILVICGHVLSFQRFCF